MDEKRSVPQLQDILELGSVVGEGTFSTVYKASLQRKRTASPDPSLPGPALAVKLITPVASPELLETELKCLLKLEGKSNVIPLLFACYHGSSLALVMPYYEHDRLSDIIHRMTSDDIRDYMTNLLVALKHLHHNGIIHRDLKPNNFLFSYRHKQYALVDFGLAQFVDVPLANVSNPDGYQACVSPTIKRRALSDVTSSGVNTSLSDAQKNVAGKTDLKDKTLHQIKTAKKTTGGKGSGKCSCYGRGKICAGCMAAPPVSACRAGTSGYRPPEVLLKYQHQTTAVDMWACGVILLSLLSGRSNFFSAHDDLTALAQLTALFGRGAICQVAHELNKNILIEMPIPDKPIPLKIVCETLRLNQKLKSHRKRESKALNIPESAYELLELLLTLNPSQRITAEQALVHPFIGYSN